MGFNVGEDEAWTQLYEAVFKKIEDLLGKKLEGEHVKQWQVYQSKAYHLGW